MSIQHIKLVASMLVFLYIAGGLATSQATQVQEQTSEPPPNTLRLDSLTKDTPPSGAGPNTDDKKATPPIDSNGPTSITARFKQLPRFALHIFREGVGQPPALSREQGALHATPVSGAYVLGPGDVLAVRCWRGPRENVNQAVAVDAEGNVQLPFLGEIPIAGETLTAASDLITKEYTRIYTSTQVSVTVARPRTVEVYVMGEARWPGKYTLPGNATVLMALRAAGGSSDIGSLRQIRLLRHSPDDAAPICQNIDLYDYLVHGRPTEETGLQTGDTVFVPVAGAEVGITGEVMRPARYELKEDERLRGLINMSGGLQPTADPATIHIWRSTAQGRQLLSVDISQIDEEHGSIQLAPGDFVEVLAAPDAPVNVVQVSGAVKRPGTYTYVAGERVSDLIRKAGGLGETAHTERGKLLRRDETRHYHALYFAVGAAMDGDGVEDRPLKDYDKVVIYTQAEMEPPSQVIIRGPVGRPGCYEGAAGMKVSDLVLQAGGLLEEAYGLCARILRRGPANRQHLVPVALYEAMRGEREADILLKRADIVEILVTEEVVTPSEVRISGYVNNPGTYKRHEGMRVTDLILMAGGLMPGAGPSLQCIRGRTQDTIDTVELSLQEDSTEEKFSVGPDLILKDDDHVAVLGSGEFVRHPPVVIIEGQVKRPGAYPLQRRGGTLWAVLQAAGGLIERANPRGIIVYRVQEQFFSAGQKYEAIAELRQVLSTFNRERKEQILERGGRSEVVQGQIGRALTNIFSSEGGATVVVPPRLLSEDVWAEAIPVSGERLIASGGREEDLELMDGDYIVVAKRTNTVGVVGAVVRSGAIPYEGPYSPHRYVELAGGAAEDANLERLVVVRANTRVVPGRRVKEVYPGDVIIVPSDFMVRTVRTSSGYERIIRSLVGLATAFLIF